MMDFPIYKLIINDNDESGVEAIALVDRPATEYNWRAFNEQPKYKFEADKEKRIISGALMVADLPIYRKDEKYGEHYVMFTKETIQQIALKFAKQGLMKSVNKMHQPSLLADGVYLFEMFLIDKERGISTPKGFDELPDGSWFGSMKVDNDDVWDNFIKTGVYKGFSVEGYFKPQEEPTLDEEVLREVLVNLI